MFAVGDAASWPDPRTGDLARNGADVGHTTSLLATTLTAAKQLAAVQATVPTALVGDRGYHSNDTLLTLRALGLRSYSPSPIVAAAAEPRSRKPSNLSMAIAGGSGAPAGSG